MSTNPQPSAMEIDSTNEDTNDNDNNNENEDEWGDNDDGFGDDGGDDGWGDPDEPLDTMEQKIDTLDPNAPDMMRSQTVAVALTDEKIDEEIDKKVNQIIEELDLERHECLLLLRLFNWNSEKIIESYFNNTENVRKDAGICINPVTEASIKSGVIECQVCMDDTNIKQVYNLICGHQTTCNKCWIDYLRDAVRTKECINLTCPAFKCNIILPQPTWKHFLNKKYKNDFERYKRFCRENFIAGSKQYSHCPGKNCDMMYNVASGIAREVECIKCHYKFCWSCKQESHHPGSCHVARNWLHKCSNESENLQWILAKTKRCPKCKVHIEKNQGCNHMTCRKAVGGCGYEFCWLCKGDWKEHGSATGGYYQCNIYEKDKKSGTVSDEEKAADDAKNELEKYEFHWTRFDSHLKSSYHALKQRETTHEKMNDLAQKFGWNLNEAQFLLDATNEAIACWHVLSWTYPIGYYFDEKKGNIELFKEHQSFLEKFCDGLQEKLDFDISKLGDNKVRQEIVHYTRTASQYRKNIVEHIEGEISF